MATSARTRHPMFALLGSMLILMGLIPASRVAAIGLPVFINEIHYDNAGADTGEFVEIAGPAGTDLGGWSIVLYNGNGGAPYRTDGLSGTIANEGGSGFGAMAISYPVDGIQNGSPDGIALVNASAQVVQFLSYEGTMTAVGGPAGGTTSVDIPVIEDGTAAAGLSIGLTGTGLTHSDFAWTTGLNDSPGLINAGQTFGTPVDTAPTVTDTTPANGATGIEPGSDLTVEFSEAVTVSASSFDVTCSNSGSHTVAVSGGPMTYGLDPTTNFVAGESCTLTVVAANVTDQDTNDPPDAMGANFVATFSIATGGGPGAPVFINEIHYDNAGTDAGEAIEVAGPAGTDLTGWSIVLYNGTGGASYDTDALPTTIPNQGGTGFGTVSLSYASNGLQNGAPDGIALVNASAQVVQFLSYEGEFTAVGGPANGMTSTNIPVIEEGTEATGLSIGLTGTGTDSADFVWTTGLVASFPGINPGQTFSTGDAAPFVQATVPANGATNVPTNTTPSITFSEPVTFGPTGPSPDPLTLVCTIQGPKAGTLNDAGDTDPATYQFVVAPFVNDDNCVLTIKAANVSDTDAADPPDNMTANHVVSFATPTTAAAPDLVINEIDYDQPSTDFTEFIEIRNNGGNAVNLDAVSVELVNGNLGGATIYLTIDLPNVSLAAGDYYVICANPATTPNCDLDGGADSNLIQNGSPDAVALRTGSTLIDTISYGGNTAAPYTEGSGSVIDPAIDFRSLNRCPDGADTDQNNLDVVVRSLTPGTVNACLDDGPTVSATAPTNGDFGVDPGTDIAITFSEAVDVTASWFSIVCTSSGAHSAAVVGGPITFGLQTAVDFTNAESCTVTILAAGVTDQDATDPPDNMPFDHSFTFTIVAPSGCDLAASHQIWEVQGPGTATPVLNQEVRVEGVVTGDFQGASALNGFFIQDGTPDADPLTSDGLFVFSNIEVAEGDLVRVTGRAIEFNGLTELSPVTAVDVCGTGSITPASYDLPRPVGTTFEPVEGVLVTFPEALTATEHFQLGRFGEVTVSSDGRLFQPTDRVAPGAPAQALAELAARRRLLIDDGSAVQNPAFVPYLTPQAVRIGDTATGITGVMSFGFSLYRLQPTETITFARTNPRPPAPANVGGDVQVASFNTLNYFTTLADDNPNARGANDANEFQRQQAKEVAAILGIDADVLGLMEVENNGATAIGSLVDALNATAGAGTYAYITEPAISPPNEFGGTFGTDAIKVAIIYKPAVVTPVGAAQTSADPIFDRPPLIQGFQRVAGSESFTVVVNHFKSKNCAAGSAPGDTDQGDGQSCFNARRVLQAEKLVSVLDTLDTPNTLVIGDLNAYTEEDPIHVLEDAGYLGLSETFVPAASRYSFVFDGFSGELDHGLAAPELADNVTGATIWHINADEPLILDYNTEFNPPGLYQPNAYRTSDHDPLIIGLDLDLTLTPIHTIQGATHISPVAGTSVNTSGIVTGLSTTTTLGRGFYIQDPNPDANIATSEAIFVFTNVAPTVSVGDSVLVTGQVAEFRPGGAATSNLTKTQLINPTILVQSTGNSLPPTTVIGVGGRVPPTTVIDDDATGDVETSGTFDAATDGIDFYESLEGMRVQVNNPVAVGPTSSNREIVVLADDGAGAALRTYRGGIIVRPTDFNPERIQLDDTLLAASTPNASVGDHFTGAGVGIVDYNFGSFEVNLTSALTTVSAGLSREVATAPGVNELVMATYNVENLTVGDPQSKFDSLANQIVNNLLSPDVIALEEIQDNNGTTGGTSNLVVDADLTLAKLIAAIDAADPAPGPVYDYRQINPVAHQDGGAPGGNIRVGFLYRTDRGLAFVDRPGGGSTDATTIVNNGGTPELSFSPGRVAPNDSAWLASRKPLAGEFTYRGQTFFLIANHFNSKSADQPLFGRFQPPNRLTEVQRHQQAQLVNDFVEFDPRRRCERQHRRPWRHQRLRVLRDDGHPDRRRHRAPRPDGWPAAERAVQLRFRGQLAGPRPHHREQQPPRDVGLRPGAHQRRVLRPGLGPRPVGRAVRSQRPADRRCGRPVQRRRGNLDHRFGDRC